MAQLTGPMPAFPVNSVDRSTTQKLPLGTRAFDNAGNEYTYVKAGATIAAADAVRFGGSATGFDDVRPTDAANQFVVGAADGTAFASGEYGFIKTRGVSTVKVAVGVAAGSLLTTSTTAGTLALSTTAADLSGTRPAVALVTGVAAGSAVHLG